MKLIDLYGKEFEKVSSQEQLAKFLADINIVNVKDLDSDSIIDPRNTIGVGNDLNLKDSVCIANLTGLRHIINENRDDFIFSVFSSCVLMKQPELFLKKPLCFFNIHLNIDLPKKESSNEFVFNVPKAEGLELKLYRFTH